MISCNQLYPRICVMNHQLASQLWVISVRTRRIVFRMVANVFILAHLNLNDEYLPYKYVIGQVIMDVRKAFIFGLCSLKITFARQKNPRIQTVVNKLNSIHAQFRYFDMELIAGKPDFTVHHVRSLNIHAVFYWQGLKRESDCSFTFDFREVYWNSRLGAEHDRLIQIFKPEDGVVSDVMAGVGPFAVPAAKRGCAVLANDLNPACAKWHRRNVEDNNVRIHF